MSFTNLVAEISKSEGRVNDDEGERQEDPEREHEHGSHQVDHVVPASNYRTPNVFLSIYRVTRR